MITFAGYSDVSPEEELRTGDMISNLGAKVVHYLVVGAFEDSTSIMLMFDDGHIDTFLHYLVLHWTGHGWQVTR